MESVLNESGKHNENTCVFNEFCKHEKSSKLVLKESSNESGNESDNASDNESDIFCLLILIACVVSFVVGFLMVIVMLGGCSC